MARGKRVLKTVRGPPHSSIRQSDSQPLDLEHNRPSASAGRFECSLPGCSSSLGTKDVFKKQAPIVRPLHRKQCIVAGCHELIAPTMS